MKTNKLINALVIASLSVSLVSCSLGKKKETQDGAPKNPKSVAHVKNAVPKDEPLSKWGNPSSYEVFGKRYYPMQSSEGFVEKGVASWYGTKFHGRRTSSGEPYDLYAMTAAHKTLPLPTYVKVKNIDNGKEVIVKVNDRGPFVGDRIIDLSFAAAKKLGIYEHGTGKVKITAINPKRFAKAKAPVNDLSTPVPTKPIYLQLGAFRDEINANLLADAARAVTQGFNVDVYPSSRRDWYRVRFGPVYTRTDLENLKSQILTSNLPSPTIISE